MHIIIKYREKKSMNIWNFRVFFLSLQAKQIENNMIQAKNHKNKEEVIADFRKAFARKRNGLKRPRRNCWICLQGGNLRSYNQLKGIWTMNTLNLIRLPRFGQNPHDIWGNHQILYWQALITYQLPKGWRSASQGMAVGAATIGG